MLTVQQELEVKVEPRRTSHKRPTEAKSFLSFRDFILRSPAFVEKKQLRLCVEVRSEVKDQVLPFQNQ